MKRIFVSLVFIATVFCIASCNKDKVYQQRHEFDSYTWGRLTDEKTITFSDIMIEDTNAVYDVWVTLRHTPYINENKIKFLLKITTPEGITRESTHTVKLKDRYNEKWIGDAAGDLIDVEERCRSFVEFPIKGSYTITLTNMGTYTKTVGIMDMGIKIIKSNLDGYNNAK